MHRRSDIGRIERGQYSKDGSKSYLQKKKPMYVHYENMAARRMRYMSDEIWLRVTRENDINEGDCY
jgi:hypothetical protein